MSSCYITISYYIISYLLFSYLFCWLVLHRIRFDSILFNFISNWFNSIRFNSIEFYLSYCTVLYLISMNNSSLFLTIVTYYEVLYWGNYGHDISLIVIILDLMWCDFTSFEFILCDIMHDNMIYVRKCLWWHT